MNLLEMAKFAASLPFSAFIINPGKAKIESIDVSRPPSCSLRNNRRYYLDNTSLSIRIDGRLAKVDDGEAIDADLTASQVRVVYLGRVTIVANDGEKVLLGENGAEVIFTTKSYKNLPSEYK